MTPLRAGIGRWYPTVWVALGLAPPVIGAADETPGMRTVVWMAVGALGLVYAGTRGAERSARPPDWLFPAALTAAIGTLSVVAAGSEALFVVSLPLYWSSLAGLYAPLLWSVAGAALATVPGLVSGAEATPGGALVVGAGLLAGGGLGAWGRRIAVQADERADRLGHELARTQRELAETHQRRGAAEERERLAREIHDTLAQGFASITALASAALTALATDSATAARRLESIEATARENLVEARALVDGKPEADGAPASVAPAVRRTVERFAANTGIATDAELDEVRLGRPERLALLRCTQESLANVRKHAGAGHVGIALTCSGDRIELEIVDDGHGFDVTTARGFGLSGMTRRMTEMGGSLTVTSVAGTGTRILAALPRSPKERR